MLKFKIKNIISNSKNAPKKNYVLVLLNLSAFLLSLISKFSKIDRGNFLNFILGHKWEQTETV